MNRFFLLVMWLLSANAFAAEETILRLQGSNTIGASLAPALAEAWLKWQGFSDVQRRITGHEETVISGRDSSGQRLTVAIAAHGSATAFTALADGYADLGMSSRPIKKEELELLAARGTFNGPQSEYVIGLDGIAVIVHPQNPLDALDKATIARIFSGEIRDWKAIGGSAGPIHVYARDDKSGTFDTFKALVLDKSPLNREALRFESSSELSDAVANDPAGIGFIGLPYVRKAKPLAIAEAETAALKPTPFTVSTEDYALARRLFFYVPPDQHQSLANAFAEFAVSMQGQTVVAQEGFVAQSILAGAEPVSSDAPDEYRTLIQGAQRLSLNFRFREGSHRPDNKALRDAARLAEYMARPENVGRHLMLYGFADKSEAIALYSLDLSIQRADGVADLLISNGLRPLRVRGYGSVAPVADNVNPLGRQRNRRVEVWIR